MGEVLKNNSTEAPKQAPIPSTETKNSPRGIETTTVAKENLNKLKSEIESGKISLESLKIYIESLKSLPKENKPFILGGILSSLNKMGISINLKNGKIELTKGNEPLWGDKDKIAGSNEVNDFQNVLNNGLPNYFDLEDLQKAFLYRTYNSLDSYLNTKLNKNDETSTSEYVLYLLSKYNITVDVDPSLPTEEKERLKKSKDKSEFFNKIHFEDETKYNLFIKTIGNAITDSQADKEFLISFFNDKYYNKGKNIKETFISDFRNQKDSNTAKTLGELNNLSAEEKQSLGITSNNKAQEMAASWSKDPMGAIKNSIENGGLHLGLILGVIGAIFWGKEGFFGGIFAGIGLAGGGINAITGLVNGKKSGKTQSGNGAGNTGESGKSNTGSATEGKESWNNIIFEKFKGVVGSISTESAEKQKDLDVWKTLSKNEKLMNSKISEIPINGTTERKMKFFVNHCGFDLSFLNENKERIKNIYGAILNERKEIIGDVLNNETLRGYLERTSKKEDSVKNPPPANALAGSTNTPTENDDSSNGLSIENLKREGYSDLYILSRGIELGYTFTRTPPSWVKPSGSMGIMGSTWYVIKTPLSMQIYKYLANTGGYFMTGGLHNSMNNGNLGKITESTGKGLNWLGKGAGKILGVELMMEKAKLNQSLNKLKGNLSRNGPEINKLNSKIQLLEKLETEMKRGNIGEIKKILREYRASFDADFELKTKGWKDVELKEHLNNFKAEEKKINEIKVDLEEKITELENKANIEKDPKKIKEYKKEIEELAKRSNAEIEKINKKAGISLSKLDEQTINSIATQSKFVDNLVKFNGGAEKFLAKFNGVGGKAFIGVGIISLIYNGRDGLGSIWDNGFSNENKNDAIDLGIGFIPVVGGLHDLKIAWDGEDLNDRKLSSGERLTRTAFGIVGLIPGAGILAKGVFKGSVAVSRGANIAIQTTNIVGKGLTYSMLGFSIATATKEIALD